MRRHPGAPDAVVGFRYQGDGDSTLDVATRLQVVLLPFRREETGYVFKHSLCIHTKETICRHEKMGEVTTFLEVGIQIILFLLTDIIY